MAHKSRIERPQYLALTRGSVIAGIPILIVRLIKEYNNNEQLNFLANLQGCSN